MEGSTKNTKFERKMTPELMLRLRDRVLGIRNTDDGKKMTCRKIAEALSAEFPEFARNTLSEYVAIVSEVHPDVFQLYVNGDISLALLAELGQTRLSAGDMKCIAEKVIEKGLQSSDVRKIKALLRDYDDMSVFEAVGIVAGEIPSRSQQAAVKAVTKNFDGLLEEVVKLSVEFRAKVSRLVDLLPVSSLEKGKVHATLFDKAYMLRHVLKEQYDFVDQRVKTYLDELMKFMSSRVHDQAGSQEVNNAQE